MIHLRMVLLVLVIESIAATPFISSTITCSPSAPPDTVVGVFNESGESYYYEVIVEGRHIIELMVCSPVASGGLIQSLQLYKVSLSEINNMTQPGWEESSSTWCGRLYVLLTGGTYTLKVTGGLDTFYSDASYTIETTCLAVSSANCRDDFTSSLKADENEWYYLEVNSSVAGPWTFSTCETTSITAALFLYEPTSDGLELIESDDGSSGLCVASSREQAVIETNLQVGYYYLVIGAVDSDVGTYKLRLDCDAFPTSSTQVSDSWIVKVSGENCGDGYEDLSPDNMYYDLYCQPCGAGQAGTYGKCEKCGFLEVPDNNLTDCEFYHPWWLYVIEILAGLGFFAAVACICKRMRSKL